MLGSHEELNPKEVVQAIVPAYNQESEDYEGKFLYMTKRLSCLDQADASFFLQKNHLARYERPYGQKSENWLELSQQLLRLGLNQFYH